MALYLVNIYEIAALYIINISNKFMTFVGTFFYSIIFSFVFYGYRIQYDQGTQYCFGPLR